MIPKLRRVIHGIGSSALAQAIAGGQAILLVPFFLRAWGAEGYGHWLALTSLISYLTLLDLGGQNYIANLLAMHHGRSEQERFRKVLSEGVSLFIFIGLGAFSSFLILLLNFSFFPVPILNRPLASWEAWVLGFWGANFLLLSVPGGIYVTAYRAWGLFTRGAMVGNFVRGVGILVSIGLLYLLVRPEIYAAAMLLMGVILTSLVFWDTRRCIPLCRNLKINLSEAQEGWGHLAGAIHFWFIGLSQSISQQGVLLIIAAFSSPAVVALYATHRTIASIPNYIKELVQGPMLPELSFLGAQRKISELAHSTFITMRTVLIVTGIFAIFLWVVTPQIYPFWTGKQLDFNPILLILFLFQGFLAAGWTISAWGLLATNRHRSAALWSLANAMITIGLAIGLVQKYGAIGVALASFAGDLVCGMMIFPVLASSFLNVSAWRVYAQIFSTALVLLPVVGIAILGSLLLKGWWSVVVFVLLGVGLTYPMLSFVIGRAEARQGVSMLRAACGWRTE